VSQQGLIFGTIDVGHDENHVQFVKISHLVLFLSYNDWQSPSIVSTMSCLKRGFKARHGDE
jgi:hypothetical protein